MVRTIVAAPVALLLASVGSANATDWPTRAVTMVVPYAAGGPVDTIGRILAARLSEILGQQVVVAGIHPDTGKPYSWPLGNLTDIARDDLPEITAAEAQQPATEVGAPPALGEDAQFGRLTGTRPRRQGRRLPGP